MTKLAKRQRAQRAPKVPKSAQMVTVRPSPVAMGLLGLGAALLRGQSLGDAVIDGIAVGVESVGGRRCEGCQAFVLWRPDEAAPACAQCGADLTNAPKLTRDEVHAALTHAMRPVGKP